MRCGFCVALDAAAGGSGFLRTNIGSGSTISGARGCVCCAWTAPAGRVGLDSAVVLAAAVAGGAGDMAAAGPSAGVPVGAGLALAIAGSAAVVAAEGGGGALAVVAAGSGAAGSGAVAEGAAALVTAASRSSARRWYARTVTMTAKPPNASSTPTSGPAQRGTRAGGAAAWCVGSGVSERVGAAARLYVSVGRLASSRLARAAASSSFGGAGGVDAGIAVVASAVAGSDAAGDGGAQGSGGSVAERPAVERLPAVDVSGDRGLPSGGAIGIVRGRGGSGLAALDRRFRVPTDVLSA
jgi:hypothetical protein